MNNIQFDTKKVRYGIKNIAPKGQPSQWAVVGTYVGQPEIVVPSQSGDLDYAKSVYMHIRQNPRLVWKAVYLEMVSIAQATQQQEPPMELGSHLVEDSLPFEPTPEELDQELVPNF